MSLSYSTRPSSPSRSLRYALDDLNISSSSVNKKFSDPLLRFKTRYSPNLKAALGASDRIQERVERILDTKDRSLVTLVLSYLVLLGLLYTVEDEVFTFYRSKSCMFSSPFTRNYAIKKKMLHS